MHTVKMPAGAQSVLEMIDAGAVAHPERPAMGISSGGRFSFISYAQLRSLSRAIAGGLIARGIRHGDRVGILLNDRAVWGLFYLGILRAGATAVPLDNLQKPHEWAAILAESEAAAIFVSSAYSDELRDECRGIPASAET